MKRPLLIFSLSLSLGIVLAYFLNSYLYITISVFLFAAISIFIKKQFLFKTYFVLGLILFYTIGAFEYTILSNCNINRLSQFADKEVIVKGYVAAEPEIKEQRINYIIDIEEVCIMDTVKPSKGKLLLSTLISDGSKAYQYGQGLEVRGQLKLPQQKRNPGGFDYRRYLAGSGISATMFAREYNINLLQSTDYNPVVKLGLMLRKRIIAVVEGSLPQEQAGLLNGMLIGRRDGLSKNVQNAFSDAGLSHIMAVSGANIAFIVFPLVFLFRRLRVRQNWANTAIIIILILFMCVTGFSPSVARAVTMAIIILLAQIIKRETDVFTSIASAAILLLIYNPFVLFDIGFQLSFGATISLVLFYKIIKEKLSFKFVPRFLAELIAVTLAAQLGVLPITAYYFNKVSIISLFSNIFVVPLTGLITVLGFIMALLGQVSLLLSQLVGLVNNTLLTFILYVTKISSEIPFTVLKVATPHILLVILYYIIIMFVFWYKPKYRPDLKIRPIFYYIAVFILIGLLGVYRLLPGRLEVVFVDVGQGDCTFIKSYTGKTVLIDGGGSAAKTGSYSNIGETTVIPFLMDYGVTSLDTVIATHGHDDHVQGLIPILKGMSVGKLIVPDSPEDKELNEVIEIAKGRGIPVYKCVAGDIIRLDSDTCFKVIHPSKGFKIDKSTSNNTSLVLKLLYKKVSMLFTGDIEKEVEDILVQKKSELRSDIIKIAHHGSPYSSTEDLLNSVKPAAAIISVGKNNFGHPSDEVLERIGEKGIRLFRTDESGAVVLSSDGLKTRIKRTIED